MSQDLEINREEDDSATKQLLSYVKNMIFYEANLTNNVKNKHENLEAEKLKIHELEMLEKKLQRLMVSKIKEIEEEECKKFNFKSDLYSTRQVALQVYELYGSYSDGFTSVEELNAETIDMSKKVRAAYRDLYKQFERDVIKKEDERNHLENEIEKLKSIGDVNQQEYHDLHLLENDLVVAESSLKSLENEYLQLEQQMEYSDHELSSLSKTEKSLLEQLKSSQNAKDTLFKLHDEQHFIEKKETLNMIKNNLGDGLNQIDHNIVELNDTISNETCELNDAYFNLSQSKASYQDYCNKCDALEKSLETVRNLGDQIKKKGDQIESLSAKLEEQERIFAESEQSFNSVKNNLSLLIENIEMKQIQNYQLKEEIDNLSVEHEELLNAIKNEKIKNESLLNKEATINNNIIKKRKEENVLLKQVHEKTKEDEQKLCEKRIAIMINIEELNKSCNMLNERMHIIEIEYDAAVKKEENHRKNHCDEFDMQFDNISKCILNFETKNENMANELKLATIDYDYLQNKVHTIQANKFGLTQILNKRNLLQMQPQQQLSKALKRGNLNKSDKKVTSKINQKMKQGQANKENTAGGNTKPQP